MSDLPIKTIVVDDEVLGREAVCTLLRSDVRFEIMCECSGGRDAIRQIGDHKPDLVFLDIQMPEVNGFDVIEGLGDNLPVIVMVTAFDEYALRAFDCHALDYVLKPIDGDRFAQAISRVVARIAEARAGTHHAGLKNLLAELNCSTVIPDRILIRTVESVVILHPDELEWLESAGNYVRIHTAGKTFIARETMTEMSRRLDSARFLRIHRSHIVNIGHVREIRPDAGGSDYTVVLRDGTELPVSRSSRTEIMALLRQE